MMIFRRVGLLVLLSLTLLTFATAACAECAWVLWQEYVVLGTSTAIDEWKIFHAGSAERACIDAKRTLFQKRTAFVKEQNARHKIDISSDEIVVRLSSGNIIYRFFCLPDTVDPRGPRGGRTK
jgi:hypothetical protein